LPYIGKVTGFPNVIIAGGHAMLGISEGTGTGKLVSEMISGKDTSVDATAFSAQRF
jgi:D-amino-acid dehydrogenase